MDIQIAQLRYLRIAPRKVRAVGDLIKGLPVDEAEAQLLVQRRRAAKPLLKLLRSALADAKNNEFLVDELYVKSLRVDQGPMLKRFLPRARGMATPLEKKMSHVTIVLAPQESPKTKRFTIVVEKKVKKTESEDRPKREKAPREEQTTKRREPGFFKRMFSRKTGA